MTETRVYGIDVEQVENETWSPKSLSDIEFVEVAEKQGLVWSLNGFQNQFNDNLINSNNIFIRFIGML